LITSALGTLILIGPMIIRRPPKRVTPNPWFWLLAFVASYWQLLVVCLLQQGCPLAPNLVTNSITILGLLVIIWARFSLGRNIGFVPAQSELVRRGAYAYMRHPVYIGGFFTSLAFLLRAYSLPNLLLIAWAFFGSSLSRAWQKRTFCKPIISMPSTCGPGGLAGSRF
jgi:protein-S-isoprenylcysteine O-methyltransferase Ste14